MTSIFLKFRSKGFISFKTYKGETMKTKFNLLIALFVIMAVGNSSAVAQTIHPVSAGDGTLKAAVDAAIAGDIIELVDNGGLYTESTSSSIYIDKPLTVRAQEGLTQRPIIQILVAWGSTGIFQIKSGGSLVLKGVELDGLYVDEAEVSNKYCIRTSEPAAEADSFHYVLKVDDCVLHHPKEAAVKEYPFTIADTLLFTNCIFDEVYNEAIHLYMEGEVKYLMVENCTFTRIGREALNVSGTNPVIRINHCTFDSISWRENKRVLYPVDVTDVEIKNSIFTNQLGTHSEVVALYGNSTISYCDTFNVGGITTEGSATIGTGMLGVDPLYTDPANDDYTLASDSPVLGMADDGLAMGDLRWIPAIPGPTVWEVAAGTDVLKTAIDGAAAGDIIELITDGGLYLSADQIVLDQDITIRGRATLPNKPVLKYVGISTSAYMFKGIESPRIALANLEFDGDGTAEGGAALAKYVVRLDNADTLGTMSLFMDNCVAHDFNDKFIKPYPDCGMDSLVVTNSIFYNGASEGITLYSGTSADPAVVLGDAVIENCTFYNLEREAIKGQTYPDTKVRVNRCTFYNLGEVDKKAMIYFRNMTDVIVKNSIFAKNPNTDLEKFADFASSASSFTNNVVWDVTNWDVGAATVTDTLHVDPQFADAANADFTIPVGSALLTHADDGGAVGDSRWALPDGFYALGVFISGEGTVAKDPDATVYAENTVVTLTATPAEYWVFDHWSDNAAAFPPDNPVTTVTMTASMAVTAYFVPIKPGYTVDISSIGYGHIEVVEFSDIALEGYFEDDSLVLTPTVDSTNWEFAYWVDLAGDSLTNVVPLTYVVKADTAFTALFRSTLTQYALNLTVTGSGEVEVDPMPVPGFETYDAGTELTLSATAKMGWDFDGYTGDATSTDNTLVITLDADKTIAATFSEIDHPDGILAIDDTWDLLDAVDYAHNNSQVDTIKLTTVGPYTPDESQRDPVNGRMPYIELNSPVAIIGADTLASSPVVKGYTSSTGSTSSEGFFRFRAGSGKLLLSNLIIEGYLDEATDAYSAKYIFRADDGIDTVFCSLDVENVSFKNTVEAFWKSYGLAYIDTMRFVNSTVSHIGKEGIYLKSVGNANYLELNNSTFMHVGRQIIYLMGMAPKIVVDHVTIDSCGYGYSTEGAKFPAFRMENCEDITISNTIISNVPFDNVDYTPYAVRISGANSSMDNCLLYNTPTKLDLQDDATAGPDNYWYDPQFAYATEHDYTLKDSSVAYHLAGDGSVAVGDLKWATSTSIAAYNALNLTVVGNGAVTLDPEPMAKFYVPSTVVTMTAVAESGWEFSAWSGDVTGTTNPTTVTMDAAKSVTVTFTELPAGINLAELPKEYSLSQNYPNPFNPNTTIRFALKHPGKTTLIVYDLLGREVLRLIDGEMEVGYHQIILNDRSLASGIYIYQLRSGTFVVAKKMIMLK